jgi:hypothetical protein
MRSLIELTGRILLNSSQMLEKCSICRLLWHTAKIIENIVNNYCVFL